MKLLGKLVVATALAAVIATSVPFLRATPTYLDIQRRAEYEPTIATPLPLIAQTVLVAEDPDFMGRSAWSSLYRSFSPLFTHKVGTGASLTAMLARCARSPDTPRDPFTQVALYILVETTLSREQILSQYLWSIYLGQYDAKPVYGVHNAAASFYKKNYDNLTVAEAALMAATTRSPALYSPRMHPDRAKARRDMILERLLDSGSITRAQFEEAVHAPLPNNA